MTKILLLIMISGLLYLSQIIQYILSSFFLSFGIVKLKYVVDRCKEVPKSIFCRAEKNILNPNERMLYGKELVTITNKY